MKVVADFLNAGKKGNKKKMAEDMLDKLYTLRKLPRKYFIEIDDELDALKKKLGKKK